MKILMLFLLLTPGISHAHGMESLEKSMRSVCFLYQDQTPVEFAQVQVLTFSKNTLLLEGETDENGCYILQAPAEDCKVIADDGMGHRLEHVLKVATDQQAQPTAAPRLPKSVLIFTGLGWILGLFGLGQLLLKKKA